MFLINPVCSNSIILIPGIQQWTTTTMWSSQSAEQYSSETDLSKVMS